MLLNLRFCVLNIIYVNRLYNKNNIRYKFFIIISKYECVTTRGHLTLIMG